MCTATQSIYMRLMYEWRDSVIWNERVSVQPHREDIIGVWVYIHCPSILHVRILNGALSVHGSGISAA